MRRPAAAAALLAACLATRPASAAAQPALNPAGPDPAGHSQAGPGGSAPDQALPASSRAAGALCQAPEAVLVTCATDAGTASICGRGKGGAVYRFGRPGHVEIEIADLHRASHGYSGGGETQVYADTATHRYLIYDRIVRTGFGADGHLDPQETSGLLVQSGGHTVSSRSCAEPAASSRLIETLVPEGTYVPH